MSEHYTPPPPSQRRAKAQAQASTITEGQRFQIAVALAVAIERLYRTRNVRCTSDTPTSNPRTWLRDAIAAKRAFAWGNRNWRIADA